MIDPPTHPPIDLADSRDGSPNAWSAVIARPWLLATAIGVLAIAASATGLMNRFAYDDLVLIASNDRVHTLDGWWGLFQSTYWPPRFGTSLYRPVTTLLFASEWVAGGGAPWVFHLASTALYAAASVAVYLLAAELLSPLAAWLAAALFAVHPVHVEAVGNIVGQAELVVGFTTALAAAIYLRGRRDDSLSHARAAAIVLLFGVGCLSKEHAILLPPLLLAAELLVVRDERPLKRRAISLAPLALALAAVGVAYLVVRTAVIGDVLGEQHLIPMDLPTRVWTMFGVAPDWVRLLVFPAHLSADYSPPTVAILHAPSVAIVPGMLVIAGTIASIVFLRRRRPAIAFALLWTAIAIAPVSNLFSGLLIAERTLFLPSVGAMLVLGALLAVLLQRRSSGSTGRMLAGAAIATVLAAGLARSALRHRVWRDNDSLFESMARDAPRSYRAQYLYGQNLFERGLAAQGEQHLRLAIELNPNPDDADPLNYLATRYREAGLCRAALPLYRRAVENVPRRPDARVGYATCLLGEGDTVAAREQARAGVERGQLVGLFESILSRAGGAASSASR